MAESRVDDLRRRLEADPGSRLFAQLAEQLRKDGDVEEAIGVARAGLEKHPNYPSARLTLGRALLDSGDAVAARAELETAVRDAPDNILASRLLGEALETLGDLEAAAKQFRATLVIAPGDAEVERRIQAVEAQLGKPDRPDHTEPMKAVSLEDGSTGTERKGPAEAGRPATAPEAGAEDDDEGGDGLAPTIRIRMPGEPVRGARAPMPPVPPATQAEAGQHEAADGQPEAREEEPPAPPASKRPEPAPGAEETGASVGDGPSAGDTAGAPTSPSLKAAEHAAGDEFSPTVPPEVVTTPQGLDARPAAPDEAERAVEAPDSAEAAAAKVTKPPVVSQAADSTSPPVAPARPETTRTPTPPEPAVPSTNSEERAAGDTETGEAGGKPLSSATLAELYLQQGLLERAIEVYSELLEAEPGNDGARARLAELEASLRASKTESRTPAEEGVDEGPGRREVLERTIKRLEALLAIVRRR